MNTQTERVVEIPWLLSRVGTPENVLDIGAIDSSYIQDLRDVASEQVVGIDTRREALPKGVELVVASVGKLPKDWNNKFDLVTCVSVLDHIGLEAYGNEEKKGELEKACKEIARVCSDRFLFTVPFGIDHVTSHPGGGQRVFDRKALGILFPRNIWTWKASTYWKLNEAGDYIQASMIDVKDCTYAEYRAAAVVAMELVKK